MSELTQRQETVLALIINEYIEAAEPVGSKALVERYSLGISSATARNEMGTLTEAGLLRQPHTSAGRVPTEEGYRYFVRRLLGETDLPEAEKRLISHQFHQVRPDVEQWVRLGASVLAPPSPRALFKHLELISTQGRQVLLVLVLQGGEVRQQMLTLASNVPELQLSEAAHEITRACLGKDAAAVAAQSQRFSTLGQEITRLVADVMSRADAVSSGEVHHDGLANMLNQPEFTDSEALRQSLRLLEESSFLEEVMAKALSPSVGGVQVVIGGEGAWEELKDCSMVLARYGAPGYATGAPGGVRA